VNSLKLRSDLHLAVNYRVLTLQGMHLKPSYNLLVIFHSGTKLEMIKLKKTKPDSMIFY